tara:strand:+ start:855 stop:998 length:144 start_codon:yes stop_codon:yes gene_type:complete
MNTGVIISIGVIIVIYYLGRYAIREGQRIESHKEFMRNMNNHGKKKK